MKRKLEGVLDFSLGNFLCLRGYAPMGLLHDISKPDDSFQRDLLVDHKAEMVAFLDEGEFLFFPELILCAYFEEVDDILGDVDRLYESVRRGESISYHGTFKIRSYVKRMVGTEDIRSVKFFNRAWIDVHDHIKTLSRIDGNHRLSATPENEKFERYNAPYCLVFFRNKSEAARFSRALFHNINYKQQPLTMEQNLRLILDDETLFSDDDLRNKPAFGWPYYLARQMNKNLDLEYLSHLKPFIEAEPRTFFVQQFKFLIEKEVLGENDNAKRRFKEALSEVNALFASHSSLCESKNCGLLSALVWYQLHRPSAIPSFIRWVLDNHLHHIEYSNGVDLVQIFDKVLASRKRTIFVSMPFSKSETENHYAVIERVCREISESKNLKPALKVERVDWFHDGTSYEINDKIIEMMSDCGLLIANLTFCNPNVYHEIGFIMGKAKAEGHETANMLLFLDESVSEAKDKYVGFNLLGIKQLRFSQTENEFAPKLQENIEKFFKLNE